MNLSISITVTSSMFYWSKNAYLYRKKLTGGMYETEKCLKWKSFLLQRWNFTFIKTGNFGSYDASSLITRNFLADFWSEFLKINESWIHAYWNENTSNNPSFLLLSFFSNCIIMWVSDDLQSHKQIFCKFKSKSS